jgi:hypothetical protein
LFRNNNPIPVWSAATDTFRSRTARSPETDNITNFSGGPFSSANQLSDYVWNRE